jgi:hypothetical protein
VKCPQCEQEMKQGWLAVFNPILWLNFVVWQPDGWSVGVVRGKPLGGLYSFLDVLYQRA